MNIRNSRIGRLCTSLIAIFFSQLAIAQIPNGYYNTAEGKTGSELRAALHNIIKNHTVVSYSNLLDAYWATDNRGNGKVWDIYSDTPNGNPPYLFNLGQDECGSYKKEGDCYNREHLWPQSWFNEKTPMKSDLFHVLPTDGYVNNRRSNYPFGEVRSATWTSRNGSKLGNCKVSGYSGTVFEPIDEYKGDIARAFFYMSTRYYGEDSGWTTSGMTNKAEIKDWAVDMLLTWNELDPVSQKEIDRNNVIYEDYQHNRNPFIDHPEYARMIWDENWQGGTTHDITVNSCTNGSITTDANSAYEGQTITLNAFPASGYELDTWNVYKTSSPSTSVTVSSNNTFTMPAFNVTVSATFKQNTTQYAISVSSSSHGSIAANATQALSGTSISLTATPESGYQLYAWYVYKTGNNNTTVEVTNNSFTMPAFNVTVFATFAPQGTSSSGDYEKVTSALNEWSGEYLIIYEDGSAAFNGGLTTLDVANNYISVNISNGTIIANETTNAAKFTIAPTEGGYSIKSASGYYIGNTSNSNSLSSSQSEIFSNSINYNNGNIDIVSSGGSYLRYNSASDQKRFRYYKSSTYTGQEAIQLYKKTSDGFMMQHTLHFNSNGGEGTMNDQQINENEATDITLNTFVHENHIFDGWNTEANGTGTFYADGAQITLFNNVTLYAQWLPQFSIICATDLPHGEISADKTEAIFEELVTLTAYPDDNYELNEWSVTDCSGNEISVTENLFEMPNCKVTISATFRPVETPFVAEYHLVTSTDQLISGRKYLIVDANKTKALGEQKTNNRAAVSISCTDNIITDKANAYELTLGGSEGAWTLHDGNGYLYAESSSNNYLRRKSEIDNNARWSITISDDNAEIIAQGQNTRNTIRYNNNDNLFSCYSSGQNDICLFIKSEHYDIQEDTELTSLTLFPFDRCTIRPDATLTVSETLSNASTENLIIKDGGQLIHSTANVAATVEKNIEGYSSEQDNFYFLASPVTSCDASCVKTGTYDLFSYDELTHYWINQKNANDNLSSTIGYLYANSSDQTLLFSGTLLPSENDFTINSLSHQANVLNGFNLVGNPFACQAYINQDFYILDNDKVILNETQNYPIKPCEAVFVKATEESNSVTFSKSIPLKSNNSIDLSVSGNRSNNIDRVRIRFDEGCAMEKFTLNENLTQLYIPQDGNHFSVVSASPTVNEMPVSFKAAKNGTYTITINTENLNVNYLHLVDNLTGADVDLLDTAVSTGSASFTFDAKTDDYASRFKIVFNNTGNSQNGDNFAFQSGKRLIIPNIGNDSEMQIFDVMGRNIMTKPCYGSFDEEIYLKSGIYTILLQSESDTQVQKIVWK